MSQEENKSSNHDVEILNAISLLTQYIELAPRIENGPTKFDARRSFELLVDEIDWLERGLNEWRDVALNSATNAKREEAFNRVALNHLKAIISEERTFAVQEAKDWLESL